MSKLRTSKPALSIPGKAEPKKPVRTRTEGLRVLKREEGACALFVIRTLVRSTNISGSGSLVLALGVCQMQP
jgi:hypothetical protein